MGNFQILTDGLCDLPDFWVAEHPQVTVVDTPITVSKGTESKILRGLKPTDFPQVAAYVDKGYSAQTSCPSIYMSDDDPEAFPPVERVTRGFLDQGKDVIYIAMSGTLSSAYDHVSALYREIAPEYPDRSVICIDSQCMSTGLGMLIMDVLDYCAENDVKKPEELIPFIEGSRAGIAHIFSWSEFSYVRKSGRVPLLPAFLGTALHFQPFCSNEYDDRADGQRYLVPVKSTVRGKEKFAKLTAAFAKKTIIDPKGTFIVAHGHVQEFADLVVKRIQQALPEATIISGPEWRVSAGIQVHGGPTSIHINYHRAQPNWFTQTCDQVKKL
jgi:DegV family protein with EDD domain